MKKGNVKSKILRNDMMLVIVFMVTACIALLIHRATQKDGDFVIVDIDGRESGRYSIDEDFSIGFDTEWGSNTLVIENGAAYVTDANCPDKLCEKQGGISRTGQTVTCLPHRLTVRIVGDEGGVDVVP